MITHALTKLLLRLNYARTLPVYMAYQTSPQKEKIKKDLDRWRDVTSDRCVPEQSDFACMNRLLTYQVPFRNLIQMRLKTPPHTLRSGIAYSITALLWHRDPTLNIATYNIGGGLFIQHGFATVIDAERIGENCWINQQVTIGYKGKGHPTIEDNCRIHCGAKVLGNITMHKNSVAGANAVVVKDVPENAIVGGVPARIIRMKEADD